MDNINRKKMCISLHNDNKIDITLSKAHIVTPYSFMRRIGNYKYEIWYKDLNYNYALDYFHRNGDIVAGACSSVRNGNFYGRNFDWIYDEHATFIVHTPRIEDRYASVGVCAMFGDNELVEDFCKTGEYSNIYKVLPFRMYDGINEFKVVASMNVVPKDKGSNIARPEENVEITLPSAMVIRFIVDHFKTARDAVEYLRKHVEIHVNKELREKDYEIHYMVADPINTYIIEVADDTYIIREVSDRPYMTNFFTYDVLFNEDKTVYTPETQDATHNAIDTNRVTEHGDGLERYNLIVQNYDSCNTFQGMRNMMNMLKYTRAYPTAPDAAEPLWYTEFLHDNLTCGTPASEFTPTMEYVGQMFLNRERGSKDNMTWQTVHSSVYDINNVKLHIICQEDGIEYTFNLTGSESSDYPEYSGPYEITPMAYTEQILDTDGKLMTDDVTVHKVPYWETENLKSGFTVYIASEV